MVASMRFKTSGFNGLFKRPFSHQRLLYLDREVSPSSPTISCCQPLVHHA